MLFILTEFDGKRNVFFEDCEACGSLVRQATLVQHLRDHGRHDLAASKEEDLKDRPPHLA